ncbi:MAG TPA: MMPL family transporter, partial [Frankiaceae bacterium]|nr:MMPL family transporter [Frankiaceae bacterium]
MLATLGRFCFRHRRIVAGLWLLLLVVGIGGGSQVFGRLSDAGGSPSTESARGGRLLDAASTVGDRVLGLVDGVPVDDPRLSVAVPAAAADLRALPGVARVTDWYGTRAAWLRATDGRATLVVVDLRKDVGDADERRVVAAVRDRLATLAMQVPGATTRVGGEAVVYEEINKQAKADTTRAEVVALPVTLLLMVVVFGGVVAASLPFLGAVASVAGTLLALLGISTALTLDPNVVSVTSGLGLGLSVDYCLLMVNRYREERGAGHCAEEAVVRTVRTAGRTILFSALTVAVCVAALFAFDNRVYRAIGAAGVSVVLVALAAALTLLPALLGLFGGRIKVPTRPVGDDGAFARLARRVQRRALPVALVVGALLLAAAGPFLGVRFRDGGAATLPTSFDSRQVADVVAARFPGAKADPIRVVAPVPQAQLADYARTLSGLPGVASVRVDPDLSGSDPSAPVSA